MQVKDARTYQTMPDMPPAQFEALKADILERGILTPIDIDEHGNILDGHHRFRACLELGISDFPTIVRPGLTEAEKRLYARKTNMMRRHLNRRQVRELISEQLKETPTWANNRIGAELGVDKKTVQSIRRRLESTGEIPKLDQFEGLDGRTRKARRGGIFATSEAELKKLLAHLAKHTGQDVETFLTAGDMITFHDPNYDVWAGLDKQQENEWHAFIYYLWKRCGYSVGGAGAHVEWLRNKDFTTPDEWLGPVGTRWARSVCMLRETTDKQREGFHKAFEQFLEENRHRVEAFKNEMASEPG